MLQENCYVVSDDTREAVIIDCGALYDAEKQAISQYITRNGLKPVHLLATHGHIDHNLGNRFVEQQWGLRVEIPAADERLIEALPEQAMQLLRMDSRAEDYAPVGRYLRADDVISFGQHQFTLIETPGHTPGGVFYYCEQEQVAFSGDTLFQGSIGRTDLPGGSMFLLIQSLRMVCQLPDEVRIYPGHGDPTTIGDEVAHNPYIDR